MTFAGAEIFVDTDVFDAISEYYQRAPALVRGELRRRARSIKKRLAEKILITPRLPSLPFVWSNDPTRNARARRWYFANKVAKGSKGGRYQRTGKLAEAWEFTISMSKDGGLVDYRNEAPGAIYVYGPRQVPSHADSGWPNVDDIGVGFSEIATAELIDTWFTLSDEFAGVT